MEAIEPLIQRLQRLLVSVDGVEAIVLGGSWATGTQRPDSDIDLGLYYHPGRPLDIAALRVIAEQVNDTPNPVVTEPGGWGRWVIGGAWLTIGGQRVDFIYRDIDFVSEIIEECNTGKAQFDYYQQTPYGFRSPIYLAEIHFARVLHDPHGTFKHLKQRVPEVPEALRARLVQGLLNESEFSLIVGEKLARRGDLLLVAGCLTRLVMNYIQVLYALNAMFFISEKKFYADIEAFTLKPDDLVAKLNRLVHPIGETVAELSETVSRAAALFHELVALVPLAGLTYRPRF